jgi:hypothetical protein
MGKGGKIAAKEESNPPSNTKKAKTEPTKKDKTPKKEKSKPLIDNVANSGTKI